MDSSEEPVEGSRLGGGSGAHPGYFLDPVFASKPLCFTYITRFTPNEEKCQHSIAKNITLLGEGY